MCWDIEKIVYDLICVKWFASWNILDFQQREKKFMSLKKKHMKTITINTAQELHFILLSVLRQAHILSQSEFSK